MRQSLPIFMITLNYHQPFMHRFVAGREMSSHDKDMAPWHFPLHLIVVMTLSVTHPAKQSHVVLYLCHCLSEQICGGRSCCTMTSSGEFTQRREIFWPFRRAHPYHAEGRQELISKCGLTWQDDLTQLNLTVSPACCRKLRQILSQQNMLYFPG